MSNQLTDKEFWLNYWERKTGLSFKVTANYPFISLLNELIVTQKIKSLLEIGGFPGYFSVWAKKNKSVEATLLDFVIHPRILHELEQANDLPVDSIGTIETDLFVYTPHKTYDLVLSNGLIEHFNDTSEIIQKHIAFLKVDGVLLITLPNFRGLNGWLQRTFDPENYSKHNIDCMDLVFLKDVCKSLNLKDVDVRYYGRFMIWLENIESQPLWVKLFLKAIWLPIKLFFKIIPLETRLFSPYIVLTAKL